MPAAGDAIPAPLDGELGGPAGGEDELVVVMGDVLLAQGGGAKIEQGHREYRLPVAIDSVKMPRRKGESKSAGQLLSIIREAP